jgi:Xaa-Pro aminopeptidase
MHYAPSEDTYSSIDGNTLELLLDSGGQYLAGTTDTTRTFLLGKPTSEFIHDYTLTMKSLIDLSSCVFLEGSTGVTIDMMARQVMWKEHMDYKCGTGHGIGYVNVVHEGPNGFRYRLVKGKNEGCVYAPGMITSIEPGVYKAGKYGIRLENNILCVPDVSNADGNFYRFETITYVPFETKALDLSLLTDEEIAWLNMYHQLVYEKLSPWVDGEMLAFLSEKTKPIAR